MAGSKIKSIKAREIRDSRENPTIAVGLETNGGIFFASVPSGASTGQNEALELRDSDGKGVFLAVKNVNEIIFPKLKGKDSSQQKEIDDLMIALDGTENKSRLGANAILAVSMAACRAGAVAQKLPLYKHIREIENCKLKIENWRMPLPMFNILEGGAHVHPVRNSVSNGAKNELDIQEFMVVPQKKSFAENLLLCNKIFQNLKKNIEKNYSSVNLGDEGGFAPPVAKTEQALYILKSAIGFGSIKIALDCAASQFYHDGKYKIEGRDLTRAELLEFYLNLIKNFPIISIEDPFAEEDWQGFEDIVPACRQAGDKLGREIYVIADDLTTTNVRRIKEAHNKLACNGVIIKPNQIGTVSETIEAVKLAKSFGWKTIVSHRSGETMDSFIADLAVGLSTDFIKSGSPAKEERMVKYNRLLEIEQELKHG